MTVAAAKKKKVVRNYRGVKPEGQINRLWMDPSRLPTVLAKQGSGSEKSSFVSYPLAKKETKDSYILRLADVLLDGPEQQNRKRPRADSQRLS